jgi:CubicO group peptidase (beta-lactamase class C family)
LLSSGSGEIESELKHLYTNKIPGIFYFYTSTHLNNSDKMKSQKVYRYMFITVLFMTMFFPINAQNKEITLAKGDVASSGITTGDVHRYTLTLDANQFVFANLFQKGIDIKITAYDPDGKVIGQFDSPNYRNGDEPISLLTDKKGTYILEVSSIDAKDWHGQYDISLVTLEQKGTSPEKQIDQIMARFNSLTSPGASIAVVKDDKIVFLKGYGIADLEHDIPITSSTVFHIASVSKQFTAFAILMLESEGKLSINDDIRKFIPEVPDFGKVITLDHLIHHTSGLRDQWELLAMAGWRLDDNISTKQILNLVSRQKELNFNPGDEMLYCNTGYTLLAEVVARVSGMSCADFTRTRIFEPLNMTHTLFYDDCEILVKNRAYSFYADGSGYKKSNLNYSTVGATSLFTTSEDLCLWSANFEKPVIGKDFIDKMAQRFVLNNGDTIGYAMGQGIYIYKGHKVFEHGGADAGYRSDLLRIPDEHFSVNVLSNLASFNPGDIASKIRDIYLADKETKEPEKIEMPEKSEMTELIADSGVALTPALLVTYGGKYLLQPPGIVVTIIAENNDLLVESQGLQKAKMVPLSASKFAIKEADAEVTFIADENGKVSKMQVAIQGQQIMAMRLPDFDPEAVNLAEFTGEYYSDELNTGYTILIESGKLIARHFRTGDINLTPLKENTFIGDKWYFGQVEFLRDENKRLTGCKVGAGRVRNLNFSRLETADISSE